MLNMARLTHEPGVAATFAGAQRGGDINDDIHAAQHSSEHQQQVYGP